MHLQKVSALAVHIGFTTASVIGGAVPEEEEIMGRRYWRQARDAALQKAGEAQARTNELAKQYRDTTLLITPIVPAAQVEDDSQHEKRQFGGWGNRNNQCNQQGGGQGGQGNQRGGQSGQAGRDAADAAKARASQIAEAYRNQFGQGGHQQRDLDTRQNAAAEAAAAANAAAGDPNAAMPSNNHQADWQSVASSYSTQYAGAGQAWADYGASAAASAESHASVVASAYNNGGNMGANGGHGNGNWHATASANSVTASYWGEYPDTAWPTPTPKYEEGAAHGTGAGVYPSATHVVEVNGVAGDKQGTLVGATVIGAGMAFLAVAFGRL